MKHKILIIDDSDFTAIYLEGLVGDKYAIEHCLDGESGVSAAISNPPNIILMDVEMPGMDGYTACRLLRQQSITLDIPIIFLSARVEPADRLAGYEVGGDDYVTKPFDPDELSRKIDVLLRNVETKRELARQVQWATNTAMTAMSSVGDSGIIMRFLREMMGCLDFQSVASCLLRSMETFGLDTSLQLRDGTESFSCSRNGICSPLEESVLNNMQSCARIVDLGSRSAFNYPHVTIIVKSMPRDTPELYGRIKDNLASIAEAVDVHLSSLERVKSALKRGDLLLDLLRKNMASLHDIEDRYRIQRAASSQILNALVADIEASFINLGLTEDQERRLQDRVRDAVDESQNLYAQEIEADGAMRALSQEFEVVLKQETQLASVKPAAATSTLAPPPATENAIELF
ncbi:MAG: response regulator receiver protein [Proteobacteria bacterium]|nr:response regulator receiver protein [Pseudomonadota bacterium]